jgi:RimJ/RimL family protein N-acetyltransferase
MFRKKVVLRTGEEILLEQITGKESAAEFQRFINSFNRERAYLGNDRPLTVKEEKEWLSEAASKNKKGSMIYLKALADGKLIGDCSAERGKFKAKGNVLVGIAILKNWRGKGLGKRMLSEVIALAKKKWEPKNVYLTVAENNAPARALYRSIGFREIGRWPDWINQYGKYEDVTMMLLKK